MFLHNLKYTVFTLFRNKILIFWTFAFPVILGIFFNMAFSNIENDEVLKVFDIAVVGNAVEEKEVKENVVEENVVKGKAAEENVAEENVVEKNVVEENVVEENVVKEKAAEEKAAKENAIVDHSNIDNSVVNHSNKYQNEAFQSQDIYKKALEELSKEENEERLFRMEYVDEAKAEQLLEDAEIEGYIVLNDGEPQVVIKENGTYQTIIRFVMNEIRQNKAMLEDLTPKVVESEMKKGNTSIDVNQIAESILDKINDNKVNMVDVSGSNLSYMQIEFYTLIAMACMYGGMLGLTAINSCLANMSSKGKRISVSPNRKSIVVLSSAIGAYVVSLVGLFILLLFLKLVIKVDFGDNVPLVILLSLVGSMAGVSLGILIASVFRVSEGAKTGMNIAITMFFSVLSGMMGVTLKYVIDKNVPVLNLINPNNLITDGFYSLYYYDTLDRYFRDIRYLIYFIVITLFISFISLRRERYDSI